MSAESISSTVPAQWSPGRVGPRTLAVRPARVADLPALAQLLVRSSPSTRLGWYGRGGSVLPLAQQEAWLAEPGGLVVEEAPGRLVAVAALRPATCTGVDDPIASAIELLVHDSWQGRGVGSSLVRALAAASHAQGRTELQVALGVDSVAADRLLLGLAVHLGGRPRLQRHPHGRCPRVHLSDRTVRSLETGAPGRADSTTAPWRLSVSAGGPVHTR